MENNILFDQLVDHSLYVEGQYFSAPGADQTYADPIHLNPKGHGELAQALYMRLAYSKEFMQKHVQILAHGLPGGGDLVHLMSYMREHPQNMPHHSNPYMFAQLQDLIEEPYRLNKQYPNCYKDFDEAIYNHRVIPPQPNELRVSFIGDSVMQGAWASLDPYWYRNVQTFLQDTGDGTYLNFGGWVYKTHQMMEKKKPYDKPLDYTFMNLAVGGAILTDPGVPHFYKNSCGYKKFEQSLPHAVFMGFGGLEPLLKNYNESTFVQTYVDFIKEIEAMPTKPIVFLALPTYGCK